MWGDPLDGDQHLPWTWFEFLNELQLPSRAILLLAAQLLHFSRAGAVDLASVSWVPSTGDAVWGSGPVGFQAGRDPTGCCPKRVNAARAFCANLSSRVGATELEAVDLAFQGKLGPSYLRVTAHRDCEAVGKRIWVLSAVLRRLGSKQSVPAWCRPYLLALVTYVWSPHGVILLDGAHHLPCMRHALFNRFSTFK